jgi:uncharacterized integral membrane protein
VDEVEGGERVRGDRRFGFGALALVVVAIALIAFVVQNTDEQQVDWLFLDATLPLWLLLLITAVLGAVLANLGGWLWRRRRD